MTRFVEERRDVFGVEPVLRVLGVSVSTHYARRSRVPSRRALEDGQLIAEIHAARTGYRRIYGARKTPADAIYNWLRHGQVPANTRAGRWCIPWDPETQQIYRQKVANSFRLKPNPPVVEIDDVC